jgi:hypothetical protein
MSHRLYSSCYRKEKRSDRILSTFDPCSAKWATLSTAFAIVAVSTTVSLNRIIHGRTGSQSA